MAGCFDTKSTMANWHPIMNAREGPVGTWSMIGPLEKPYATMLVRRGDELGVCLVALLRAICS